MSEGPNTPHGEDLKREYADERDMDRFWEVARLEREPARQWWYIPLILALIFMSIPWLTPPDFVKVAEEGPLAIFVGTELFGLPFWIWITGACTLGLSILTSFAVLRFWRDGDSDSD